MPKLLYPAAHDLGSLSDAQIALKIARHSSCTACSVCSGLHPSLEDTVILDNETNPDVAMFDLTAYGSDDDEGFGPSEYLSRCACGHGVIEHASSPAELGQEEYIRRARVAIRLDELLQDLNRLEDFLYMNVDIASLRRQMTFFQLPDAPLHSPSFASQSSPATSEFRPSKRPRSNSSSSLSNLDSDDDESEGRPLASRSTESHNGLVPFGDTEASPAVTPMPPPSPTPVATPTPTSTQAPNITPPTLKNSKSWGKRSGKQSGMKAKASTAPAPTVPKTDEQLAQMNDATRGVNNAAEEQHAPVKLEDQMDDGQLGRLATGIPIDTASHTNRFSSIKEEKPAALELARGIIKIVPVENDGTPRSTVILTGLKTLFQKQLPKMPREYIARLVYDVNSRGLSIIKKGLKVVGGICFRPFPHRGFAEIVFFATASTDQIKGYGAMLMDHFKTHIKATYPGMMHFLTYADNYAVGYFRKQGFSKDITLERSIWAGYIKDYEGGTIMLCTMLRKVNYLEKAAIITAQKEAILTKIRQKSKSHYVYEGLKEFQGATEGVTVDPLQVPGLRETGWTLAMAASHMNGPPRSAEHAFMKRLLADLQGHAQAWAFTKPVDKKLVPDYYEVIKNPMDFHTMEAKLQAGQYSDRKMFLDDAQLVFDNCRLYNPADSIYAKNATKLEKFLRDKVNEKMKQGE